MYNICPMTFSFQDIHHPQTAQAIKWSNHGRLVVTIGVRDETPTSLCLTARSTTWSSPGRTVSRKSRYRWAVNLTGSRQGAHNNVADDSCPNADPEANLTPTFTDNMRIILHCCGRWTHHHEKNILRLSIECYVNRALPKSADVTTRKSASVEDDRLEQVCALQELWYGCNWGTSTGTVPILVRYGVTSPRLSSHSCHYGILICCCPYSPWATSIHMCRAC
jgi:hypothetical protein